jgi:hypothetical protein
MQDTQQQQRTLCELNLAETIESPALCDPAVPSEGPEQDPAEGTGRKRSFIRILLGALGAWPS